MNVSTKCAANPYYFLAINTTLAFDNTLDFRKNLIERTYKLIMRTDDKVRDETLQYDVTRDTPNISEISSGKIDKYEYITGQEILPPDQSRMLEQAKFTRYLLGKELKKQIKYQIEKKKKLKIKDNTKKKKKKKHLKLMEKLLD